MATTKTNPKTGKSIGTAKEKGGKLTTAGRIALPKKEFALPPSEKAKASGEKGSYPIPDKAHAKNALSRVSQFGTSEEKAKVRAAVKRKYPDIKQSKGSKGSR